MTTRARKLFEELMVPSSTDRWSRVEALKLDAEEESLWLDFKEVKPTAVPAKEQFIKDKFARALSGFSNTEGGVVIYGVKTNGLRKTGTPDRAQEIVEIQDVAIFRAGLEKLASTLVDPVISGVVVQEVTNPAHSTSGVVVVYVPQSDGGPHRVVKASDELNDRYFMRTTTEFVTMPHALLADRFGRRASPRLKLRIQYCRTAAPWFQFRLYNHGRGVARRPAVQIFAAPPGLAFRESESAKYGFAVRIDHAESGQPRWLLEPTDDIVLYPGMDRIIAYANESRPSDPSAEHRFRVVLHAVDVEPIEADCILKEHRSDDGFEHKLAILPTGDDSIVR